MKVRVAREEMQEKLANIQNIVEKKNTMPILSHFLLTAAKKGSSITATDMETALREPIDIAVEKEGKICIPARKMFEIVREVESELSFESTDDQWLKVKSGASEFKLACLPHGEFPVWPASLGGADIEELRIAGSALLEMIEKTLYSAGESDTRYTLNGLLLHLKPEAQVLSVVGTDGHRLATIQKRIDGITAERKVIVPRKAVSELRRFLPEDNDEGQQNTVTVAIGEKHILFTTGTIQFLARQIEGSYPNYESVIPRSNEKKVSIEREVFAKVLRRVSVMSRERASAVQMDLADDRMTLFSSSPDLGEAKEELAVDYKGDAITLGFNARYLLDVLNAMTSERVILEIQDPLSPVLVKEGGNEEYQCVIMPMRI